MKIARYEVTTSDGNGRIADTRVFRASQLEDARQYRQDHPSTEGWTVWESSSGGESTEPGLHAGRKDV